MPKTRMGYDRIKNLHAAGDHSRCQFGCCPDNQTPNITQEFAEGQLEASRELAERLGRDDPRIALAMDAREFLDESARIRADLPSLTLIEIGCIAESADDLSGDKPNSLDLLRVRRGRRILNDAKGVHHNLNNWAVGRRGGLCFGSLLSPSRCF
jgi:hypothetical protein